MTIVKKIADPDQLRILNKGIPEPGTKTYDDWKVELRTTALDHEKALKEKIEEAEREHGLKKDPGPNKIARVTHPYVFALQGRMMKVNSKSKSKVFNFE